MGHHEKSPQWSEMYRARAMNEPSIELKLLVNSTRKMRQQIQTFRANSAAATAAVVHRWERPWPPLKTIEARRHAAQQLLADLDGLRADGLRESRQIGLPGVLGQCLRPVAAEHQALRSE